MVHSRWHNCSSLFVVKESELWTYATDSRDRLYLILRLSTNAKELRITADYSKSCREVYVDVAKALLKRGDLEILTMYCPGGEVSGRPSWVPDWTAPIIIPWMGYRIRVDTILEYGNARTGEPRTIRETNTYEDLRYEFKQVEQFVLEGRTISGENRVNAVWCIHIADRGSSGGLQSRRRATAIARDTIGI